MPRLIVSVSEEQRELWVRCAHAELVSLSEWLRRAAGVRANGLGVEPALPGAAVSGEESVRSAPESTPEQPLRDGQPRSCPRGNRHHIYHSGKPCPDCGHPNVKEGYYGHRS